MTNKIQYLGNLLSSSTKTMMKIFLLSPPGTPLTSMRRMIQSSNNLLGGMAEVNKYKIMRSHGSHKEVEIGNRGEDNKEVVVDGREIMRCLMGAEGSKM